MRTTMWVAALSVGLGAAGSARQVPAADPAKPKTICKRTVETGSLVSKRRECRTRAEWDRIAEAARMGGQDIVDGNMGRPPGQ